MRNEAADRFANNVLTRTEHDLLLRLSLLVITAFVMPFVAGVVAAAVCQMYVDDGTLNASSMEIVAYVYMVVFCSIVSFIMFSMIGRAQAHLVRDDEWFSSLIDYAASKGCDTTRLEKRSQVTGRVSLQVTRTISLACWVSTLVLLVLSLFYFTHDLSNRFPSLFLILTYIVLLLQFFLAMGPTIRFAGNHEHGQAEFTRTLRNSLGAKGIDIEALVPVIGKPHRILWLILTIVTLGLFHVVLVVYSIYALNRHIYNQWAYEEELLQVIMRAEGAKGIEIAPKVKD